MKDPFTFIKENLSLIEEDKWEEFYKNASSSKGTENYCPVGEITNILLECGIDPLRNMKYIPEHFLSNIVEIKGNLNLKDKNILTIWEDAFYNCQGLKELSIPEGVEELGNSAISMCFNLKEVRFPSTIKRVGNFNFYRCPVEKIYFNGTMKEWDSLKLPRQMFFFKAKTSLIHCLDGKTNLRH